MVLADPQAVVGSFTAETVVHAGDDLPASAYAETLAELPALSAPVLALTGGSEDPGVVASAVEFVLEGLHLTKRLNKEAAGSARDLPRPRMTWRFDYRRWDGTQESPGRRHRRGPLAADRRPAGQR